LRGSDGAGFTRAASGAFGEHAAHGSDGKVSACHRSLHRGAQGVVAMAFQQYEEFLHTSTGEPWLAVRNLGEQHESLRSEVENLLSFLVKLGPLAVDGGDLRGAVLRQGCPCGKRA
jgi:hypothetical protein